MQKRRVSQSRPTMTGSVGSRPFVSATTDTESLQKKLKPSLHPSVVEAQEKRSRNGKRILHGEEGKGRFRALALGRVAEWQVTSRNRAGEMVQYCITIIKDNARNVRITVPVPAPAGSVSGVEVCIGKLKLRE